MSRDPEVVIAIDAGSSAIRVLGAQVTLDGGLELLTFGQSASLGIKRGLVDDVDEASYAIRTALEDAGLEARLNNAVVVAGITGKHIKSFSTMGEVKVGRNDGMITEKDVTKARDAARAFAVDTGAWMLHNVPGGLRVDGYRCRRSPIGMQGSTTHAETHIVTANQESVEALRRASQMAGIDVDAFLSGAVSASRAVVSRSEFEMGVVHLDIGAGTTDATGYFENALLHTSSIPVGGNQLANDIATALNTSFAVGEGVLHDHGAAYSKGDALQEEITIPCYGMSGYRRFRRAYLIEVVRLRMAELFQLGWAAAMGSWPQQQRPASLVISGGVAALPGIAELATEVLGVVARVGESGDDAILLREEEPLLELRGPAYASILGLLRTYRDPNFGPVRRRQLEQSGGSRLLAQLQGLRA